ncbi:uncharacterized protein [Miscanthus floridulus]|uniref:uncharacterized protein n=1 Tax=Miscanthus floridulus TaxID=154761 RepID=UPI003459E66D
MAILWWTALKRSLSCKSQGSCDVIKRDDDSRGASAREFNHKKSSFLLQPSSSLPRSGCSRSISNLRDVIHSARFQAPPAAACGKCDSPMSVESCGVLNAVTHDVLLASGTPVSRSARDLRVGAGAGAAPGLAAWDIGAVPPFAHSPLLMRSATGARLSQRKSPLLLGAGVYGDAGSPLPAWASCDEVAVRCNRCGGLFPNDNALESHHLVYHAVTEVADGETASKVVELIYSVGWPNPEVALDRVERVVKVHSMERRVDRFKEYMEEVKGRAAGLTNNNKHPRCVADGNELLQFHGTTVSCSLGAGGSHSVCTSSLCNVCRIIRHGFSRNGGVGVFTTSTSKHALDCLQETSAAGGGTGEDGPDGGVKHALFVCRVIAGRIHHPLEKLRLDVAVQPGFDSVAGQVGDDSSIEELYLLNPRALLPCFVVICKA